MSLLRLILAAFIGALLAKAALLDRRAARATGRSVRAALPLVPSEAI